MSPATSDRLTNLAFVAGATVAIGLSFWLKPSPAGIGTHEQLGLPRCHFYQWTHLPCFSCGMTTSWAHMAHGQPLQALRAQPMGAVLFLAAAAAGLASLVCLFRGSTVERRLAGRGKKLSLLFMAGMLGAWIYKIVETLSR